MTDRANHLVPEQGKLHRALAAVFAWLQAMEYTSFDHTLDRIERLEREVGQLKGNCAKAAIRGPSILTTVAPLGWNIDSAGESPHSARVADQNGPISKTLIFAPHATPASGRFCSPGMSAVCAKQTTRVDVKRTLRTFNTSNNC